MKAGIICLIIAFISLPSPHPALFVVFAPLGAFLIWLSIKGAQKEARGRRIQ